MALDLVELLDYLKIDSAHLVGVSMGGMIAQVTATIRPSRVKSLTSIMSASGNPRTGTGKVKAIYSLFMHPEQPDNPEKLFEHFCRVFNTLKVLNMNIRVKNKKNSCETPAKFLLTRRERKGSFWPF